MNIIRIQKVIAHKKWEYVEVIEGSDEHKAIILWNKVKNAQIYFDKKEQDYETEQRQNEVSMDELREESGFDPIDPDELTPEEYAIKEMIRQILWNEVQSLPELQRDIVVLHIYKGVSLREIGRIKGINHSSVCKSYKSAKDKLRERLLEKNIF